MLLLSFRYPSHAADAELETASSISGVGIHVELAQKTACPKLSTCSYVGMTERRGDTNNLHMNTMYSIAVDAPLYANGF